MKKLIALFVMILIPTMAFGTHNRISTVRTSYNVVDVSRFAAPVYYNTPYVPIVPAAVPVCNAHVDQQTLTQSYAPIAVQQTIPTPVYTQYVPVAYTQRFEVRYAQAYAPVRTVVRQNVYSAPQRVFVRQNIYDVPQKVFVPRDVHRNFNAAHAPASVDINVQRGILGRQNISIRQNNAGVARQPVNVNVNNRGLFQRLRRNLNISVR